MNSHANRSNLIFTYITPGETARQTIAVCTLAGVWGFVYYGLIYHQAQCFHKLEDLLSITNLNSYSTAVAVVSGNGVWDGASTAIRKAESGEVFVLQQRGFCRTPSMQYYFPFLNINNDKTELKKIKFYNRTPLCVTIAPTISSKSYTKN